MRLVHFPVTSIGPCDVHPENVNGIKTLTKEDVEHFGKNTLWRTATEGDTYVSTGDTALCFSTPEVFASVKNRLININATVSEFKHVGMDQGEHVILHQPTDTRYHMSDGDLDNFWRSPVGLEDPKDPGEKLPDNLDRTAVHLAPIGK